MKIYPKYYYPDIYHIPYNTLFEKGIRGIIFDIDNTLVSYDQELPTKDIEKLMLLLKKRGFSIILVSNNSKYRVRRFAQKMKLKSIFSAVKPLPFSIWRGLKILGTNRHNTVIIGDQLFTDIIAGNLVGIGTILVPPIQEKEAFYTKIKRGLEKKLLEYDQAAKDRWKENE